MKTLLQEPLERKTSIQERGSNLGNEIQTDPFPDRMSPQAASFLRATLRTLTPILHKLRRFVNVFRHQIDSIYTITVFFGIFIWRSHFLPLYLQQRVGSYVDWETQHLHRTEEHR